jgi:[protein-PII] uridylyltransferase
MVGDEERLDLLFLLTAADMRGVGAHAFPRWKDALLTSLYQHARERLRGHVREPVDAAHRRAEVVARLPAGVAEADLDRHLSLVPERYALEVEPFDVALHLRLARDLESGRDPATAHVVEGPLRHFWVCTRDRKGLFATVAGAIAARGASIVSADAYTRADGIVLDKVTLVVPAEQAEDEAFWEDLERLLADVLSGRRRIEDVVAAARGRIPYRAAPRAAPRPAVVKVLPKLSERFTVIDVGAEDRVGLLYDLAHAIAALGLDIRFSKISTRANRAADVFYVTRAGRKVEDPEEVAAIQSALVEAADRPPG